MNLISRVILILYLLVPSVLTLEIYSKEGLKRYEENPINSNDQSEKYLNEKNYIVGPGDVFRLDFLGKEEETFFKQTEFEVIKTGKAYIPIIGELYLEGLTYSETYQLIKDKYSDELITPQFTLKLISARPALISVVGEVRSPGVYTMIDEIQIQDNSNSRITDVLLKAGGLTKDSNIRNITLLRKLPDSNGGGYKKANLNLYDLVFKGDHSQNPIIFDGDLIKVSKVDSSQKLPKTNFTETLIEVYIVGEVLKPGKILIKNGTQIAQAIYYAGGPKDLRANTQKIQLLRTNKNGSISLNKYNLKLKKYNKSLKNPILEDGDIIRVAPTILSKTSDIIKETSTPVLNIFALYKIFD